MTKIEKSLFEKYFSGTKILFMTFWFLLEISSNIWQTNDETKQMGKYDFFSKFFKLYDIYEIVLPVGAFNQHNKKRYKNKGKQILFTKYLKLIPIVLFNRFFWHLSPWKIFHKKSFKIWRHDCIKMVNKSIM